MRRQQGFTIIELMIVVVVIAVLSAIALPSYTDYVTRSKFAEAYAHLADLRVKMEQYYLDNKRYSSNAGGGRFSTRTASAGMSVSRPDTTS